MSAAEKLKEAEAKPSKPKLKLVQPPVAMAKVQALIDIGIPLRKVVFGRTVVSITGEPEFAFYSPEPNLRPSRVAKLWYTPHGIVCEQAGSYKIIPLANVLDTFVL